MLPPGAALDGTVHALYAAAPAIRGRAKRPVQSRAVTRQPLQHGPESRSWKIDSGPVRDGDNGHPELVHVIGRRARSVTTIVYATQSPGSFTDLRCRLAVLAGMAGPPIPECAPSANKGGSGRASTAHGAWRRSRRSPQRRSSRSRRELRPRRAAPPASRSNRPSAGRLPGNILCACYAALPPRTCCREGLGRAPHQQIFE